MSTTVTYKGQTLTTVENQTKTLNTAGTWVEGDFTLTDVTQGGDEQYFIDLFAMNHTVIDDSKITTMGDALLYQTRNATGMRWRELTSVKGQTFRGVNKMTYAIFDKLLSTTSDMISYSALLTTAEFGAVTELAHYTFENDPKFDTLILRTPTLVRLAGQRVFDNTCFKSGGTGGTIYIPKAMYDHLGDGTALDYQSATNWSVVHGWGTITWTAIEGSYYETHHADGSEVTA